MSRQPLCTLVAALIFTPLVGISVAACNRTPSRGPIAPPQSLTKDEIAAVSEAREQKEAQTAWCVYLQELYKRAAEGATSWPRYEQCTEITTMAAPKMLKHTAECSLQALRSFKGDPFTTEYASMVSKCGDEALDKVVVTKDEIAPFVATICGRMTACGQAEYAECREKLATSVGPHLERAIGAINTKGRAQLRACMKNVACDDITGQISACVQPLMEGLLWLPG